VSAVNDPTSTTTVQPSDLTAPVDIVDSCAASLAEGNGTAAVGSRRLLADATSTELALDALTRTFSVISGVQSALLSSLVDGESASAGSGGLVATAAVVDLSAFNEARNFSLGSSAAVVTLLQDFAILVGSAGGAKQALLRVC
jgi:hypothetical protein